MVGILQIDDFLETNDTGINNSQLKPHIEFSAYQLETHISLI